MWFFFPLYRSGSLSVPRLQFVRTNRGSTLMSNAFNLFLYYPFSLSCSSPFKPCNSTTSKAPSQTSFSARQIGQPARDNLFFFSRVLLHRLIIYFSSSFFIRLSFAVFFHYVYTWATHSTKVNDATHCFQSQRRSSFACRILSLVDIRLFD